MKLYGYELLWQTVLSDVQELRQTETARQVMEQMYPCTVQEKQLLIVRGLSTDGTAEVPVLYLPARVTYREQAPCICPSDGGWQLCADTLRETFGVDGDTLASMREMLDGLASDDALPALLGLWSRLLSGYCTVQPEVIGLAVVCRAQPAVQQAQLPEDLGACDLSSWASAATVYAAQGERVVLASRNRDHLLALRAQFSDDVPVLCAWDDAERVRQLVARVLEDMDQTETLSRTAERMQAQLDALSGRLQAARETVKALGRQPQATPEEQAAHDRVLPDAIAPGSAFPLTPAQIDLLRQPPQTDMACQPDEAEQLMARWEQCARRYLAAPVRQNGQAAAIRVDGLQLGVGDPGTDADTGSLVLRLNAFSNLLAQEDWLYDVLSCRNRAQMALYEVLVEAFRAAGACTSGQADVLEYTVSYRGRASERAQALQTLCELEEVCAVWEDSEPYTHSEWSMWRAVRAAAKKHHMLVDGKPPRTREQCRAARVALELETCRQAIRRAWEPLRGQSPVPDGDPQVLAGVLDACIACSRNGLHLQADSFPLSDETRTCIEQAYAVAQARTDLCSRLSGEPELVQQAVHRLDAAAYRAARDAAAYAARGAQIEARRAVVEQVRRITPLWAEQLERKACPDVDLQEIWLEKSRRTQDSRQMGQWLAHERSLTMQWEQTKREVRALRMRMAAAARAAADPLLYAQMHRAVRSEPGAVHGADCALIYLTQEMQTKRFAVGILDGQGMLDAQCAAWNRGIGQGYRITLRPVRVPEVHLVCADGTMEYCRAAEALSKGQISDRKYQISWQAQDDRSVLTLAGQALRRGERVVVVCADREETAQMLRESLPEDVLLTGNLYCDGPEVLAVRQFDTVVLCPDLSESVCEQAMRGSMDSAVLWLLDADRYGADWGKGLLRRAWGLDCQEDRAQTSYIARVLTELYGWEVHAQADGLTLYTPSGPVWLALLEQDACYPMDTAMRRAHYAAGWQLDGLYLHECLSHPRQALERLAVYEGVQTGAPAETEEPTATRVAHSDGL